jgi:nucleolar pre-ribosomal-associated protein 1
MGKRTSVDADGAAAFRKRQKITHDVPTGEDVNTGEQLQRLLSFDQDMRRARHGELNANSAKHTSTLRLHEAKIR